MYNFVYCFDKNYIIQALTSFNSLLLNISEKINCYVICDDIETISYFENYFKNHKKINELQLFLFEKSINFPKLENSHVSQATYFRIFMDEYLPDYLENIIYLDSDILCLNDPINQINLAISKMYNSKLTISAVTEGTSLDSPILFEKLKLNGEKYFNAGVLIINLNDWRSNNIKNKLLDIMNLRAEDLIFWDQDVMNIFFDGKYVEIDPSFNFNFTKLEKKLDLKDENITFLHYSGKQKPWLMENILLPESHYYQYYYQKLRLEKYHVVIKIKTKNFKKFLSSIIRFKFLQLDYPFQYFKIIFVNLSNILFKKRCIK